MYISIENETQNVTKQDQDKKLKKLVQFYISKSNNKHGLYNTTHIGMYYKHRNKLHKYIPQ